MERMKCLIAASWLTGVLVAGMAEATVVPQVVGVGVDRTLNQAWVAGWFDSDGNGIGDRWQMTRYNAAGTDSVGFNPDPGNTLLGVIGGGGVDNSGGGAQGQPWLIGPRDSNNDQVRDSWQAWRFSATTGADTFGFALDSGTGVPYGEVSRLGGTDPNFTANDIWAVGRRDPGASNPNRLQLARYNARTTGAADIGGLLPTDFLDAEGIGVGNFNQGSIDVTANRLYVVGNVNGTQSIRHYSLTTMAEVGGWGIDPLNRFLDAHGVGVDPVTGQPWIVGPFDSNTDGQRDNFTARRYDPASGSDNLGFGLTSGLGTIVGASGVGVDGNRQPWFLVELDTNADGFTDRWGLQRYNISTGSPDSDFFLDSRFAVAPIPEPSTLLLGGIGGLLLALCRRSLRNRKAPCES